MTSRVFSVIAPSIAARSRSKRAGSSFTLRGTVSAATSIGSMQNHAGSEKITSSPASSTRRTEGQGDRAKRPRGQREVHRLEGEAELLADMLGEMLGEEGTRFGYALE